MAGPIVGPMTKFSIGKETTPGTAVTPTQRVEWLPGSDLKLTQEVIDTSGLTGTRSHWALRTRAGVKRVAGKLILEPNPVEWGVILPWILGAAASGNTYALAESLQAFTCEVVRDNNVAGGADGKVTTYAGCYVDKATITCEAGRPLRCDLDLIGFTEALTNNGTGTVLTLNTAAPPFMFSDSSGALSINSIATPCRKIEIVIDNVLDKSRFLNSKTISAAPSTDRLIQVSLWPPYGNATALLPTDATTESGWPITMTFTGPVGTTSILWSFVLVHFGEQTPPLNGREELDLPLIGMAKQTAATKELVVTCSTT